MGLNGYYQRFVQNYGLIAAPLTQLTRKNSFIWLNDATLALEALKTAMVTLPTLTLPNFNIPFVIETNASSTGLGAVITQQHCPIAFFSQRLSPQARLKSVYEQKMMAIVLAVQKWRRYLLGHKFTVCTDQRALKHLLEQREVPPQYQKWLTKLLGYDFEILYQPGLLNKVVDALSRTWRSRIELHYSSVLGGYNISSTRSGSRPEVENYYHTVGTRPGWRTTSTYFIRIDWSCQRNRFYYRLYFTHFMIRCWVVTQGS